MKRRFESVEVEVARGWPISVRWRGHLCRVREWVDAWVVEGRWWADEERRICFRVVTDRGTFDLYRSGENWVLSKQID